MTTPLPTATVFRDSTATTSRIYQIIVPQATKDINGDTVYIPQLINGVTSEALTKALTGLQAKIAACAAADTAWAAAHPDPTSVSAITPTNAG